MSKSHFTSKMVFPSKKERATSAETVKKLLNCDIENGILTWKVWRLNIARVGDVAGGSDGNGYQRVMLHGKYFLSHRVVWLFANGDWPNSELDHINRIRDDNRISNLRLATASHNALNRGMRSDNTTGYKGVSFCKKHQKFFAQIWYNKGNHFLGFFDTPDKASVAYKNAAVIHHEIVPIA